MQAILLSRSTGHIMLQTTPQNTYAVLNDLFLLDLKAEAYLIILAAGMYGWDIAKRVY